MRSTKSYGCAETTYEPLLPAGRRAVPGAGFADAPAPRAAQAARQAPARDADRAAAEYLATADERIDGERIALIEKQLGDSQDPASLALRQRAARLRGALTFRLETEYHERLTAAHVHWNELNQYVEALERQYETSSGRGKRHAQLRRLRRPDRTAPHARPRRAPARQRLDGAAGTADRNRGHQQLKARRERLVDQQTQARYAVADSYDRRARVQSGAEAH
jgi:hypothetical protein